MATCFRPDALRAGIVALLLSGACGAQTSGGEAAAGSSAETESAASAEGSKSERSVVSMDKDAIRMSRLIGAVVVDIEGAEIGEVDDIVFSGEGTLEAVLAIGGFAGLGEKLVLVSWNLLDIPVFREAAADEGTDPRVALREMTGRELADSRPQFRYEQQ